MAISFLLNGQPVSLDIEPEMPLLWVVRDELGLRGTKFGCGVAACGACIVHINGKSRHSCSVAVGDAEGTDVRTIEMLARNDTLHPLQAAWIKHQVPQCGYCQSGMLMAAAALIAQNPDPSDQDIDMAVTNICRCGTYNRVRAAIKEAASMMREGASHG